MIKPGITNAVIVLVHPPDNCIKGNHKTLRKYPGARTTNGNVPGIESPEFQASTGWNRLPIIRGRETGIWNDLFFNIRDDVSIKDYWVSSVLLLPDTTKPDFTIHVDLESKL